MNYDLSMPWSIMHSVSMEINADRIVMLGFPCLKYYILKLDQSEVCIIEIQRNSFNSQSSRLLGN